MTSTSLIVICLASFVISIMLAYRLKLNTGIIAMSFAYLIGCFLMRLSVSEIVNLFSVKIFFLLFSVCFFYGYAIENGTLNILAGHVIYSFRNRTKILPFVLYFLAFFLAVLGASAPAISSFMAPICIMIAESTNIHYLIMLVLIALGSGAGSLVPWGQGGLIIRGIIEGTEFAPDATTITLIICLNLFMTGLIALVCVYFFYKGHRAAPCDIPKAEKLNLVQKKTLAVLTVVLALVLVPTMINTLHPAEVIRQFAALFDIQMLSIVGGSVCAVLKLGDEKKILARSVPWNTIIMVCGVCMLLGVTERTGLFERIITVFENPMPLSMVACILVLIGGFMSFFSGAMSVVVPTLLPLVVAIAASGNYPVATLASALCVGAVMTCMSPFSTAGSFILSCLPEAKTRDEMFGKQFLLTMVLYLIPIVLSVVGGYNLL